MAEIDGTAHIAPRSSSSLQAFRDLRPLALGTVLYLLAGSAFLSHVGADPIDLVGGVGRSVMMFFLLATVLVPWWLLPALAAPVLLSGRLRRKLHQRALPVLLSIVLCSLFTFMFGLVKNRMSLVVPFWADDALTQLDLLLHFGLAPRDLLLWLEPLQIGRLFKLYFNSWVFLATFFPVLLIAFDDNLERRRTFTILWMLCWAGLGNVIALAGMSYGPIFADLFPGGPAPAHQGVLAMLERADASSLLATKMSLWRAYTGESQMLGSGISAFPSVHVGMATVIGLYLARIGADAARSRGAQPRRAAGLRWGGRALGMLNVIFYAVLSVYLGWHYAVDGYASILVIGGLYAALAARLPLRVPEASLPGSALATAPGRG